MKSLVIINPTAKSLERLKENFYRCYNILDNADLYCDNKVELTDKYIELTVKKQQIFL